MLLDSSLLVHYRRSSPTLHHYHSKLLLLDDEALVAQISPVRMQAWFASLGQEAPDLPRPLR